MILVMLCAFLVKTSAQESLGGMSFHHDPSIMNQFTVMETGAGALTPPAYYNAAHKHYQASAYLTNKNMLRMAHSHSANNQISKADSIKSKLATRAKVSSLELVSSDPNMDMAWKVEGPKIESAMEMFNKNINRIMPCGGTDDDYKNWEMMYKCIQSGINIIRKSYLTLGQRQEKYISYHKEILQKNIALTKRLRQWRGYKEADEFNKMGINRVKLTKHETVAFDCMLRWKQNVEIANAGNTKKE